MEAVPEKRRERSGRAIPVVATAVLATVLLACLVAASAWLTRSEADQARGEVAQRLAPYANSLTASVNVRLAMLSGLHDFISVSLPAGPDERELGAFAAGLTARAAGIRAVQVAPDGVFTFVYPSEGNPAPGLNLFEDERPEVKADVARALASDHMIISGPYELRQGGLGLVSRRAVRGADGEFWGFVVMVLDLPPILAEAGLDDAPPGLRIGVRDAEGRVFTGEAAVFDESPVVFPSRLPDGRWEIAAVPVEGWEAASRRGQAWLWSAGLVIAGSLSVLAFLLLGQRERLKARVSERTRLLEEQRDLFRRVTETSPVGITVIDVDGRIALANARAESVLGLERAAISLRTYDDPAWKIVDVYGGPFPQEELPVARVLATGAPVFDVRHGIEWPGGERRILSVNAAPLRDSEGKSTGVVTSIMDITEREEAEQTLRRQDRLLREMGRAALVGGWEFDPRTGEGTWTEETARIHDLDPARPTGVDMGLSFYQGEHRRRIEQAIEEAVSRGVPFELELELVSAAGAHKWVHTVGRPVVEDGEVVRLQGSFQDITRRKQAELQVVALNRELESRVERRTADLRAANRELESFSYSVSHDLRAPLRAIDGFSQALLEDYGPVLDAEGKGLLDRVRAAAGRMAEIIDDLLSLSRLSRQELRVVDVDLSRLVEESILELRERHPDRRVETRVRPGARVRADENLMRAVLDNLLGNAFKFTERTEDAFIEFGFREEEGAVWYFVRDNGAGFDMKYADKLFGAFQRLHSTDEFDGTGIGLAIVKRIMERHGGAVRCEGAVDGGATFAFSFDGSGDG